METRGPIEPRAIEKILRWGGTRGSFCCDTLFVRVVVQARYLMWWQKSKDSEPTYRLEHSANPGEFLWAEAGGKTCFLQQPKAAVLQGSSFLFSWAPAVAPPLCFENADWSGHLLTGWQSMWNSWHYSVFMMLLLEAQNKNILFALTRAARWFRFFHYFPCPWALVARCFWPAGCRQQCGWNCHVINHFSWMHSRCHVPQFFRPLLATATTFTLGKILHNCKTPTWLRWLENAAKG